MTSQISYTNDLTLPRSISGTSGRVDAPDIDDGVQRLAPATNVATM
ncbi:MAG: hypothetical protein AAGF73_19105 [Actinomycetota bacterium]